MEMTYEEIFHTMTEQEVRYKLDALQEANKRLQIALDIAEKGYKETLQAKKSLEFEFNYKMNQHKKMAEIVLGEEAQ